MSEHVLKIHPEPFKDIASGAKNCEVRDCSDRDFKAGDAVVLVEINPENGERTMRELRKTIAHVQHGYGLPKGICVLSYALPEGYVLVPVEPSDDMLDAMHDSGLVGDDNDLREFYKAMLAAAQEVE